MNKKKLIIGIVLAALALLTAMCVCASVASWMVPPSTRTQVDGKEIANVPTETEKQNNSTTNEQNATSAPTSLSAEDQISTIVAGTMQALPTATTAPTATETAVPTATATAAPSPTPAPTRWQDSPEIKAYASEVVELSNTCVTSLTAFVAINGQIQDNVNVIFDDSWKYRMAVSLVGIQKSCGAFNTVTNVPAQMQPAHQKLIQVSQQYLLFVDAYTRGVDNIDANSLMQGIQYMDEANRLMDEALALIPNLK